MLWGEKRGDSTGEERNHSVTAVGRFVDEEGASSDWSWPPVGRGGSLAESPE